MERSKADTKEKRSPTGLSYSSGHRDALIRMVSQMRHCQMYREERVTLGKVRVGLLASLL